MCACVCVCVRVFYEEIRTIQCLSKTMSALVHKKIYKLSDRSFRDIKHNTVPLNLFFNKRSDAVVMSPDPEGLGAADVAGVASNLTQPSGISYFSLYTFFLKYLHQQ